MLCNNTWLVTTLLLVGLFCFSHHKRITQTIDELIKCPPGTQAGIQSSQYGSQSSSSSPARKYCVKCPKDTFSQDGKVCERCPDGYHSVQEEGSRRCEQNLHSAPTSIKDFTVPVSLDYLKSNESLLINSSNINSNDNSNSTLDSKEIDPGERNQTVPGVNRVQKVNVYLVVATVLLVVIVIVLIVSIVCLGEGGTTLRKKTEIEISVTKARCMSDVHEEDAELASMLDDRVSQA